MTSLQGGESPGVGGMDRTVRRWDSRTEKWVETERSIVEG